MIEVDYKYARALIDIATEKEDIEDFQRQINDIRDIIKETPEFGTFLTSPNIDRDKKKRIISKIFSGAVEEDLLNFIFLLIDKDRQDRLNEIMELFIKLGDRERNIAKAHVYTLDRLEDESTELLQQRLSNVLGKNVVIENYVDNSILGGILVKVGDIMFDGSLRGKLEALRNRMENTSVKGIGVTGVDES
jgi:F-type H+-transporting ATPase subunit delta